MSNVTSLNIIFFFLKKRKLNMHNDVIIILFKMITITKMVVFSVIFISFSYSKCFSIFKFLDSWIEACFPTPVFITSIVVQNDPVVWNLQNKISYRLKYKLGIFNGFYTKKNQTTVCVIFCIYWYYFCFCQTQNYEL